MSDTNARLRAAILDIDGTLLDSNGAHAQAWADALSENGYQVPVEQVRRLIGEGGDKLLPQVSGLTKDSPEGKAIDRRRSEIFNERYLPQLQPTPGARQLLERMRDGGLKLVVATSAKSEEVQGLLRAAGVADLIEAETSSGDVKNSKPDPDIVHAALERAGCSREQAVMLGDTPYDVEACVRAGVPIVAFRSGGWDNSELKGAAAVYDDPQDLLEHYDQSPLGDGNRA